MVRRNVPLVEQVILELLADIDRGEFVRSNGMLPSEAELALHFSVSRATVRDALSRLETTGVVIRRQGIGTFVNQFLSKHPAAMQDWFEEAHGFVDALRSMGRNPEVLHPALDNPACGRHGPPPATDTRGSGHRGREGYYVGRRAADPQSERHTACFAAAEMPAAGAQSWRAACDSTFRFLEEHCRSRVHHQQSEIRAVVTGEKLASLLACHAGEPCLQVEEVAYSADLAPLFYGLNHFRGDTVSFRQIRRPTINLSRL